MVDRERLRKDILGLVRIAYEHLPRVADAFFSKILERPDRLDDAIGSLPNICRTQASAMVRVARDIGLHDTVICALAREAQLTIRCGASAETPHDEPPPPPLYSEELEALGYVYET